MSTEETEVVIMTKKPDKAPHLIMNAVLITSLFGSIINSTILGISAAKGKILFNNCFIHSSLSSILASILKII